MTNPRALLLTVSFLTVATRSQTAWAPVPSLQRRVDCAVASALAARGGSGEASVLAPWELGAALLYHARVPVVASGYHRNLAGIRDGYRAFLSQEAAGELGALLRRPADPGLPAELCQRAAGATARRRRRAAVSVYERR